MAHDVELTAGLNTDDVKRGVDNVSSGVMSMVGQITAGMLSAQTIHLAVMAAINSVTSVLDEAKKAYDAYADSIERAGGALDGYMRARKIIDQDHQHELEIIGEKSAGWNNLAKSYRNAWTAFVGAAFGDQSTSKLGLGIGGVYGIAANMFGIAAEAGLRTDYENYRRSAGVYKEDTSVGYYWDPEAGDYLPTYMSLSDAPKPQRPKPTPVSRAKTKRPTPWTFTGNEAPYFGAPYSPLWGAPVYTDYEREAMGYSPSDASALGINTNMSYEFEVSKRAQARMAEELARTEDQYRKQLELQARFGSAFTGAFRQMFEDGRLSLGRIKDAFLSTLADIAAEKAGNWLAGVVTGTMSGGRS